MKQRDYIINLYEIYKELFTLKQKICFEQYYFEDLSLSEISENNNVSRAFVSKTINNVKSKLLYYENVLKIYEKNKMIEQFVKDKNLKEKLLNL